MKKPTHINFYITLTGRADIEGSKSSVAMIACSRKNYLWLIFKQSHVIVLPYTQWYIHMQTYAHTETYRHKHTNTLTHKDILIHTHNKTKSTMTHAQWHIFLYKDPFLYGVRVSKYFLKNNIHIFIFRVF